MAKLKKENNESIQRAELHRKIWAIADEVRGAVDGWDFKQYILGILFYRFISENITDFFNSAEHEAGDLEFDYAEISDEEAEADFRPNTVEDKGFFINFDKLIEVIPNSVLEDVLNLEINEESILEIFDYIDDRLDGEHLDGIIGGPPCQAYSTIGRGNNKHKKETDVRIYLYEYYVQFLERYKPSFFVFENVKGLLSFKD